MQKELQATLRGKTVYIEADHVTPIEMNTIVRKVEEEMLAYEQKKGVPDTIKQLIYVAIKYGMQLYKYEQKELSLNAQYENKIDEFISKLESLESEDKLF